MMGAMVASVIIVETSKQEDSSWVYLMILSVALLIGA